MPEGTNVVALPPRPEIHGRFTTMKLDTDPDDSLTAIIANQKNPTNPYTLTSVTRVQFTPETVGYVVVLEYA